MTKTIHDLSTSARSTRAIREIKDLVSEQCVHLWASLPCKPWGAWSELNWRKLDKKFEDHLTILREESLEMIEVFQQAGEIVLADGGSVSFEWPAYCVGWGRLGNPDFRAILQSASVL